MYTGTVKWFNETKGFGFISNDDGSGDVSSTSLRHPVPASAPGLRARRSPSALSPIPRTPANCGPPTSARSDFPETHPPLLGVGVFSLSTLSFRPRRSILLLRSISPRPDSRRQTRVASGRHIPTVFAALRRGPWPYFGTPPVCGIRGAHAHLSCFAPERGGFAVIVYRKQRPRPGIWAFSIQTLYAVSNSLPRHYHPAELPSGTARFATLRAGPAPQNHPAPHCRPLAAPSARLPCATAYRCGAGLLRNATPHVGETADFEAGHPGFFRQRALFCCERICLSSLYLCRASAGSSSPCCAIMTRAAPGGRPAPHHLQPDSSGLRSNGGHRVPGGTSPIPATATISLFPAALTPGRSKPLRGRSCAAGASFSQHPQDPPAPGRRPADSHGAHRERAPGGAAPAAPETAAGTLLLPALRCGGAPGPDRAGPAARAYLQSLLGRVSYVLQIEPERTEARQWREWLLEALARTT